MYETAAEYRFTTSSNGARCLGAGWAPLEKTHVWSISPEAELHIPVEAGGGNLQLHLLLSAFTAPPRFTRQRVRIDVNGVQLGEEKICGEAAIGIDLPRAELGEPETLRIRLRLPDALQPKAARVSDDERQLGIALQEVLVLRVPPEGPVAKRVLPPLPFGAGADAARMAEMARGFTGLGVAELAAQFESLGHNCEFGFAQRQMGAEPMGLLRFAGIRPHSLLRGLDCGFPGAEDPELLELHVEELLGGEFMLHNSRWGMDSHTDRYEGQITEAALLEEQSRKLRFYRRKFLEVLETGEKLFVYQHHDPISERQVLPLLATLRSYGANALLFVRQDRERPAGSVEKLRAGLYMGSVDRLAPGDRVDTLNLPAWISLCANAYRLWREEGGGA